jgi:hypothetical protein
MNTKKVIENSKLCRSLTGLSSEKFKELVEKVIPLWDRVAYAKTPKNKRKRDIGAGRRYELSVEEAILLVLIHLRTYETYAFLGFIFNKDLSTAYRYIQRFRPLIESVIDIPENKEALNRDDILLIVDAIEQNTERRKGSGYSGKKKSHTIKTQLITSKKGKIYHISQSVSGNIHDKKLFDLTKIPKKIQKRIISDLGYLGTDCILPHKSSKLCKLTNTQKKKNKKHSVIRISIEHLFAHLKNWKILANRLQYDI